MGSSSQSKTWSVPGTYNVRVRARCTTDNSVISDWSFSLSVTITAETVSTPNTPSGPVSGLTGRSNTDPPVALHQILTIQWSTSLIGRGMVQTSLCGVPLPNLRHGPLQVFIASELGRDAPKTFLFCLIGQIPLSVSISVPDISITPKAYDFGVVKVKRSNTASFIAKNNGTVNLSINSGITNKDASMFRITMNGGSKAIKPGKTLTIRVVFKPTSTGTKNSALRIISNDPDTATIDIPLIGTGQ